MAVILATWEVEIGSFEASLGREFVKLYLNQYLGTVAHTCPSKLHRRLRLGGLSF
jgi:hypothetical protein